MEKFWGSSSNEMQLEQIFIEWIIKSYKGSQDHRFSVVVTI